MNISFKAISKNTISALNTEVTGQVDLGSGKQLPEVKYREFFNYETDVLEALKQRAKNNNNYDIFVTEPYTDKNIVNTKYANEYGDCLSIVDRRTKEIVKNIPDAIHKKLSPAQMLNNLKFAVLTAEKMSEDSKKGLWNKISNQFKKPVILKLNQNSEYKIFNNTIEQYRAHDSNLLERIEAPKTTELNADGLEITENKKNLYNYKKYNSKIEDVKCHHNIVQRCFGTPDEKNELESFLKNVSPKMADAKTFTQKDYSKLTEKQKEKLREFFNTAVELSFGKNRVKATIKDDAMFLAGFSNIVKENLDKKYGKDQYILIGLGSSPSCMMELMEEKPYKSIHIPFSIEVLDQGSYNLKETNEYVDWKNYFKSFGLSPEDIEAYKKHDKKVVFIDYISTGKTKEKFEQLLKYRAGIPDTDYSFEDVGELCWDPDSCKTEDFIHIYLTSQKGKLYSVTQNAGNSVDFYENHEEYAKEYKWNPLTKLLFFAYYDKKDEMKKDFQTWIQEKIPRPYRYF